MPERKPGSQHAGSGTRAAGVSGDPTDTKSVILGSLSKIKDQYQNQTLVYQNIRVAQGQDASDLRVISGEGYAGVRAKEKIKGNYTFRWVPPAKSNLVIDTFKEGIKSICMHSFGSTYENSKLKQAVYFSPGSDLALGPEVPEGQYRKVTGTGYNVNRFNAGIRELTITTARTVAVHHLVSLRGDIVNSVSWDNRCDHTGDIASLGIEHEEYYVKKSPGSQRAYILDHAPYGMETFVADAYIIKKLQAYTGLTFTRFLGTGTELSNNLKSSVSGCYNHNSVFSAHNDPAAQYYFPPDYELRKTALSSNSMLRPEDIPRWQKWLDRWFPSNDPNYKAGTRISAYAHIFDMVGRMRDFDVQTQLFDATLRTALKIETPQVTATHHMGPLQRAAINRAIAYNRADQMQGTPRAALFSAAKDNTQRSAEMWATQLVTLEQILQARANAPVIENALRLDSNTGVWFRVTTKNA